MYKEKCKLQGLLVLCLFLGSAADMLRSLIWIIVNVGLTTGSRLQKNEKYWKMKLTLNIILKNNEVVWSIE